MRSQYDPEGSRLPIKVDETSNGEFIPRPLDKASLAANQLASEQASRHARRLGLDRRSFLTSACGAASTLLAFNQAHAAFGQGGGFFDLPPAAALDEAAAEEALVKREFIFDIQGHHVNPLERWRAPTMDMARALQFMPHGRCSYLDPDSEFGHVECFTGQAFIKEMFLDSDTDLAVLSFPPTSLEDEPLTNEEAARTQELVDALAGNRRLLVHGRVVPNLDGDIARMPEMAERWGISAWKTYTQASPDGTSGWWLDDERHGAPLIEMARKTGVRAICIHKGLPLPTPMMTSDNRLYGGCRDVGRAARMYPDIDFIIYHSGYDLREKDGPFVPGDHRIGVDSLIQSLIENDIPPNSNVYAELGTTWRYLMRDPEEAAHVMGKLLRYVGVDNVLWGTDSIWYGSPQDQILAFRTFQISRELRETHGYPEITPEIRAKVFGLNAVKPYKIDPEEVRRSQQRDTMAQAKLRNAEHPDPTFLTYGPKTRREFFRMNFGQDG
ncbi:MAG: amidohydrolase family protein [Chromatiales bacterium]|nr:amidohydrolase family protein [Chromatiales bacterium]